MKVDEVRTEYEESELEYIGRLASRAVGVFAPLYLLAHLVAFFM